MVADEQAGESQIAGAVEEALQPEVRRTLTSEFERPAVPHDEPRSPREQQDEILDELRWKDPRDAPE